MSRFAFAVGVLFITVYSDAAFSQPKSVIAGVGYVSPVPVAAAPGQVVTIFVHGVGQNLSDDLTASGSTLPTNLGGISATLKQTLGQTTTQRTTSVPLFAVRPLQPCPDAFSSECDPVVALTVQIPFELAPNNPLALTPTFNQAVLLVSENGLDGEPVGLKPEPDQIHVVTSCDAESSFGVVCAPLVTHPDATLVSAVNPAQAGETLVMYAFGLGSVDVRVPSGERSPEPAAVVPAPISISFEFEPNAPPKRRAGGQDPPPARPTFVGLTPGFVGLYQANFQVPPLPPAIPSCGPGLRSNLTVSIAGTTSFDGAGICVGSGLSASLGDNGAQAASGNPTRRQAVSPEAGGPFVPNFIHFPPGVDLADLAKPVPDVNQPIWAIRRRGELPTRVTTSVAALP